MRIKLVLDFLLELFPDGICNVLNEMYRFFLLIFLNPKTLYKKTQYKI